MKSRLLLNIIMLLVLSTLIVLVLFFIPEKNVEEKLTALKADDITTIFIPRKKDNIELKKIDGQWQMFSPYTMPAHDFRINHLLKLTQLSSQKVYAADTLDLRNFNLKPARARIRFNQTWVDFGKTNPITQQRYLKSGNKIFLAYDDSYALINSQPSSFVNLSLLPQNEKIQTIQLPQQLLQLKQHRWTITPADDISADEIQTFIQNWKNAQAFGVHAYLKRKQLGTINIQLENKTITFEITDKSPWLVLARPDIDIEYHLNENMLKKLLQISPRENTDHSDAQ